MAVEISGLKFSYPGREVLKGIDLQIGDGEFLGITGPTGSGKTTLIYCLNGLIPHSIGGKFSGSVSVFGMDTKKHRVSELARKVGFVFQDPDWQIFNLSIKDEIAFGLKNLKMDNIDARIEKAIKFAGLEGYEEEMPHRLSHGQKQKLSIACVLAMEPEMIVLDEPTSQLDYRSKISIYDMLRRLNREGKTIVVVEHDTDLLWDYAGKAFLIDGGMGIAHGPAKKVLSRRKLLEEIGVKSPAGASK